GNSSTVVRLDLSNLRLQGNLSLVCGFRSLKWLDLSFNSFRGAIDRAFGDLPDLEFLDLSFNKLEGSIPPELGRLRNLRSLNLSSNYLVGAIPDELRGLSMLQELQLFTNRLGGSIPSWVGNLTDLQLFAAYENQLSGVIPDGLGSVSQLQLLNLHSNRLRGSIPETVFLSGKLEALVLTRNGFTGSIPASIGNCTRLSSVRIGDNDLVGGIPREVGHITSLTYFEANGNRLSGEIVPEFSTCSNLTLLNLASNAFTGTVPAEFGSLSNLQELIVSGNNLVGNIPTSVLRGENLSKLDLSNNGFNGTIPGSSICSAPRLQFLLLSRNSIQGEIPHEIGNCTKLLELQLDSNSLRGSIPPELGRLKNLQVSLNLSFNGLQGEIPEELGRLDKLVSFDVSNNELSGGIPSALKGMLSLIQVNFSNNLLTGPVPSFSPFQKSSNSSFLGNKGLCGAPLATSCGGLKFPDENHLRKASSSSYRITLAVIGCGLAVFASVVVVVLLFMLKENQEKAASATASLRQAIDFEAVYRAVLKESNALATGTFSTVYRADMPSGVVVSARRLKLMDKTVGNQRNKMMMIREVERLGKLRHDNLMRPIGFILSEEDTLLLHEHYPNGTLADFLRHSSSRTPPDWPTRLSIAIGIAQGLAFLHLATIIHLDVSSGNIVLDSNFNPLVSEVEISRLLDPSKGTGSITAVAGSFGYIPPEYAYTMQVTAPGNVYSYGVILLEILTSQQPVDEAFGEGMDLVKWVRGAAARGDTPEQILDPKLSTVSFSWRKEMLAALKIALLCTDNSPAKRPKMQNVVEMLQEIKQNLV
ncbi:hypothetical protein M569_06271, partial [Genlisea aurea]